MGLIKNLKVGLNKNEYNVTDAFGNIINDGDFVAYVCPSSKVIKQGIALGFTEKSIQIARTNDKGDIKGNTYINRFSNQVYKMYYP